MKYLTRGEEVDFVETDDIYVDEKLPVGTYVLKHNDLRGFYLAKVTNFKNEGRIYGDAEDLADMIFKGYKQRETSTGALLHGYKGTGKSNLVRMICEKLIDDGCPVIVINECYEGSDFLAVFGKLPNCGVVFDEFEKVYKPHEQPELLSVFDGMSTTKSLFLLTANDYNKIDTHLINRPGRLLYSIEFEGLTSEIIDEYLDVNLLNKEHADSIRSVFSVYSAVTFDMIKGVVDEVNRTDMSAKKIIKYMNIDMYGDSFAQYRVHVFHGNECLNDEYIHQGNPLGSKQVSVWFDHDDKFNEYTLTFNDFVKVNGPGEIEFSKNGYKILFKEIPPKSFNYNAV